MSYYDYATLTVQWLSLTEDRFNCPKQFDDLKKRRFNSVEAKQKALENFDIQRGHHKIHTKPLLSIDNINIYRCPCQFRNPRFATYQTMFNLYEKGQLPFEGSLSEQPAYIIEVMEHFRYLKDRTREEQSKKQEAELKRKQASNRSSKQRG